MKKTTRIIALLLSTVLLLSAAAMAASVKVDTDIPMVDVKELTADLKKDQTFTLADPAPWNLEELKQVVNVKDPRSVAAYFVWAVNRLVWNYDDGMEMMKYLFADIEPYGRGFTEGGMSGKAGWDSYMTERLKMEDYKWLPRAYLEGASESNGFQPTRPVTVELYYNSTNTETINAQSFEQLGRLNIVYWVKSHAAGHQVNITVSRFEGSDRWYVTSGTTSAALFYDQRSGVSSAAKTAAGAVADDGSTQAEHAAKYGGPLPFTDVKEGDWFYEFVSEMYGKKIIAGQTATTFNPNGNLTYGAALKLLTVGVTGKDVGNATSGHWATNYLNEAVAAGWTAIGADKLDAPVTREAFCEIAAKAKNLTEKAENPFKDTTNESVLALVKAGVISGMSADTFNPAGVLTRAQIAKIISLLIKL